MESLSSILQLGLGLQRLFGRKKTGDTFDQSLKLLNIEAINAAKIVQDFGFGMASSWTALIVSQLHIGDTWAILIFAGHGSDIHDPNILINRQKVNSMTTDRVSTDFELFFSPLNWIYVTYPRQGDRDVPLTVEDGLKGNLPFKSKI